MVRRLARVGANSTVLPGVEIGEGALVGAGSVIVHDVPAGAVVAGNPARVIKLVSELTCPPGFLSGLTCGSRIRSRSDTTGSCVVSRRCPRGPNPVGGRRQERRVCLVLQ